MRTLLGFAVNERQTSIYLFTPHIETIASYKITNKPDGTHTQQE